MGDRRRGQGSTPDWDFTLAGALLVVLVSTVAAGHHWSPLWLVVVPELLAGLCLVAGAYSWRCRRRDRSEPRRSLEDLERFDLSPTRFGPGRRSALSILEAVALYAGEGRTRAPACVSPVVARWVETIGEHGPQWARDELRPLIPHIAASGASGNDEGRLEVVRLATKHLVGLVTSWGQGTGPAPLPRSAQCPLDVPHDPEGDWLVLMDLVLASPGLAPARERRFWRELVDITPAVCGW